MFSQGLMISLFLISLYAKKDDEEKWYSMPESQRLFYLWQSLARDMEEIKKKITK